MTRSRFSAAGLALVYLALALPAARGEFLVGTGMRIITPDPSSEKDVARLLDAASGSSTRPGELWRYTSPYRGLAAMEEKDSDYFFGRERETIDVLSALAVAVDRLPVLLGNSGVGKSSLAQAGVLAAVKRQAWPERVDNAPEWPQAFRDSRAAASCRRPNRRSGTRSLQRRPSCAEIPDECGDERGAFGESADLHVLALGVRVIADGAEAVEDGDS